MGFPYGILVQPVAQRGDSDLVLEEIRVSPGEMDRCAGGRINTQLWGTTMKSLSPTRALCATFLLQLFLSGALAQEPGEGAEAAPLLEEIVVTSRRIEESIQNVPISIT